MNKFSEDRVKDEIEYIGKKAGTLGITNVHLADVNFEMYPQDRKTCEMLVEVNKKYGWPLQIMSTTGKNSKKRIMEMTTILGDMFDVSMSMQSMDEQVLNNIKILKEKFKCRVGLSDHSKDKRVAIAARAEIIEKHIALDNQKRGLDIEFSLKGKQIRNFKENIDLAYILLGKKQFHRNKTENKSKIFRRSIFVTEDISKGEKFNTKNIRRIRPGYGLEPKYYEKLIGKKTPFRLYKGEPLKKTLLNKLNIK